MGCLNDTGEFTHWFGNIHLSGPCNRKCYFCIGQHMMALDKYNILDKWPLDNLDVFFELCKAKNVKEINLTGTNTDPLLYKHIGNLSWQIKKRNLSFGIRTNAVANLDQLRYFDKGSVTICSFNKEIYQAMMGIGVPPNMDNILNYTNKFFVDGFKINIVLGPENTQNKDVLQTLSILESYGIKRVNLREPYGQPYVGDPLKGLFTPIKFIYGMPVYNFADTLMEVTYWDVHYVEVESVNLYANGRCSLTYPITKGHDSNGIVLDQTHFSGGRITEQWI